jgi:hypothetical protein
MRVAATILVAFGLMLGFYSASAIGDEKDEVKLKGRITCAKCDLKMAKKCETVIVVKEDKKDVIYYFDGPSHTKYHSDICEAGKAGMVTATVSKQGDKRFISVKELKYE